MPILIASGLISFDVNSIWFLISFIGTFNMENTPDVFCEVIAVIAVIAYEPRLVIVFISACIPAPPEESEPAITNILDFSFNLINRFFYNIDTIL